MKRIFIITLTVIFVLPMITCASWWNPFSWSRLSFLFSSNGEKTQSKTVPVIIPLCPEIVDEMDYITNTYKRFDKEYYDINLSIGNSSVFLKNIQFFQDDLNNESHEIKYLSATDWAIVKDNLLNFSISLKQASLTGKDSDFRASDSYYYTARDLYYKISGEEYNKVYGYCVEKVTKDKK